MYLSLQPVIVDYQHAWGRGRGRECAREVGGGEGLAEHVAVGAGGRGREGEGREGEVGVHVVVARAA